MKHNHCRFIFKTQQGAHDKDLYVSRFSGTEALSQPYHVEIHLLSHKTTIDGTTILGYGATLQLQYANGRQAVYFHGIVSRLIRHGGQPVHYEVTLIPWFHVLDGPSDYRIFQHKSVMEIFKNVCSKHHAYHYDCRGLRNIYPSLAYCVQYKETSFSFLQRLLAAAGIFYYFKHQADRHIMVLLDDPQQLPSYQKVDDEELVTRDWQMQFSDHANGIISDDYADLTAQHTTRTYVAATQEDKGTARFYFPGYHSAKQQAFTVNQRRLAALTWPAHKITAISHQANLYAGLRFSKQQQYYWIHSVTHHGQQHRQALSSWDGQYENQFQCVSSKYPYQPSAIKKPMIPGCHLAVVTGPKEKLVHRDEHGRVKVNFLWDKPPPANPYVSCWLRVAETMAGHRSGWQFTPRIGDKVVVNYVDGDIDRPYISGSLYHTAHDLPFDAAKTHSQMGIRTQTLNSQNPEDGHMILIDDTPQQENFLIQSQQHYQHHAEHDTQFTVQNQAHIQVNGHYKLKSASHVTITAEQGITLTAGNSRLTITADSISIQANQVELGDQA